jgi:hypothetical protein
MHLSLPIDESRFRRQIERFIRTIVPPQSRPFNSRDSIAIMQVSAKSGRLPDFSVTPSPTHDTILAT